MENLVLIKQAKVRTTSSSTLVVSIPPSFWREKGLKAGDQVSIMASPDNDDLVLRFKKVEHDQI